ncbi:PREDICTED: collagen alpha-1(I) chain-like [Lipotes vexillifer]|uniref:Collagen alpha-1(I) chain-like n=1 Tax=Lipotes vexillifer TaxID=118797 RepID=A0A340X687_LIPVE|nr:PREDICTED: collagen alpha-1(I) chain-like [Lipotes vexillifer]
MPQRSGPGPVARPPARTHDARPPPQPRSRGGKGRPREPASPPVPSRRVALEAGGDRWDSGGRRAGPPTTQRQSEPIVNTSCAGGPGAAETLQRRAESQDPATSRPPGFYGLATARGPDRARHTSRPGGGEREAARPAPPPQWKAQPPSPLPRLSAQHRPLPPFSLARDGDPGPAPRPGSPCVASRAAAGRERVGRRAESACGGGESAVSARSGRPGARRGSGAERDAESGAAGCRGSPPLPPLRRRRRRAE